MRFSEMKKQIKAKVLPVAVGALTTVGAASADLAGDLANMTTVITSVVGWVTSVMAVFMSPPLSIFVGMAIAGRVIGKVKSLMGI